MLAREALAEDIEAGLQIAEELFDDIEVERNAVLALITRTAHFRIVEIDPGNVVVVGACRRGRRRLHVGGAVMGVGQGDGEVAEAGVLPTVLEAGDEQGGIAAADAAQGIIRAGETGAGYRILADGAVI